MTWSIQPIGNRAQEPSALSRIEPSRRVHDREPRDEDDRRQGSGRNRRGPAPDGPPVADADGHIDVLA